MRERTQAERRRRAALLAGAALGLGLVLAFGPNWQQPTQEPRIVDAGPSDRRASAPSASEAPRVAPTPSGAVASASAGAASDPPPTDYCLKQREQAMRLVRSRPNQANGKPPCLLGEYQGGFPFFWGCAAGPKGQWAMRYDWVKSSDETAGLSEQVEECFHTIARARVVHLDDAGHELSWTPKYERDQAGDEYNALHEQSWAYRTFEFIQVVDVDGDDDPEILFSDDDRSGESFRLLTARGGAIVDYPGTEKIHVNRLKDVDGDGRLDILSRGPYVDIRFGSEEGGGAIVVKPVFVYHALADGSFALDGVSEAALRDLCPKPPTQFASDDLYGSTNTLVCARAWGVSAERVMRALRPHCPEVETMADPCGTAQEVLAVEPPIRLRP